MEILMVVIGLFCLCGAITNVILWWRHGDEFCPVDFLIMLVSGAALIVGAFYG